MIGDGVPASWKLASLALPDGLDRALRQAYREPPRRYHTWGHARRVAQTADLLGGTRATLLAAWVHDVIYQPTAADNEAASSRWLGHQAPSDPDLAEAQRLIMLTATHRVEDGDEQGAILCDADLSILGSHPRIYRAYTRAVRQEYGHLDDDEWRRGRAAVVRGLHTRTHLFRTAVGVHRWDRQARHNLEDELARLNLV